MHSQQVIRKNELELQSLNSSNLQTIYTDKFKLKLKLPQFNCFFCIHLIYFDNAYD